MDSWDFKLTSITFSHFLFKNNDIIVYIKYNQEQLLLLQFKQYMSCATIDLYIYREKDWRSGRTNQLTIVTDNSWPHHPEDVAGLPSLVELKVSKQH